MSEEQKRSGGEFERGPIPDSALLGSSKFWWMYAGNSLIYSLLYLPIRTFNPMVEGSAPTRPPFLNGCAPYPKTSCSEMRRFHTFFRRIQRRTDVWYGSGSKPITLSYLQLAAQTRNRVSRNKPRFYFSVQP